MITNLHQLYIHQIKDLESAERQIIDALPSMIEKAQSSELKEAFQDHLEQTRNQLQRISKILAFHGELSGTEECQAIKGIVKEGKHLMNELVGDAVDPGLIAAAQRIEHYEITAYGTTKEYAEALDYDQDVSLLDETLEEEADANEKLTKLATGGFFSSGVNAEAMA